MLVNGIERKNLSIYDEKIIAFILDVRQTKNVDLVKREIVSFLKKLKEGDKVYLPNQNDVFETPGKAVSILTNYPFGEHSLHFLLKYSFNTLSQYDTDKLFIVLTDSNKIDDYECKKMFKKLKSCEVIFFEIGHDVLNVENKVVVENNISLIDRIYGEHDGR